MTTARPLTAGEVALARTVFRDSVDYDRVPIYPRRYVLFQPADSGMTPNGRIYACGAAYQPDYSACDLDRQAFFIHEMAHVWQHQNRVLPVKTSAVLAMCRHGFRYARAYRYTLAPNRDLLDYNLEQQATIIEDYFRVRLNDADFARGRDGVTRIQNPPGERVPLLESAIRRFILDPRYASSTSRAAS